MLKRKKKEGMTNDGRRMTQGNVAMGTCIEQEKY
ncbi:hypothetical protein Coch_1777 [Capnocytophaga ochracea DSM 7271]|uniref:Uncharacterized protein n=1 Tax=Capnocytophaga ochracea (strain ATCC 27872 / DSM 7271 / CCUG 9716 / JCM 12966 / NCTC 12371 / SS31 / VPI 2845) TaxID=521097 RepID=C7M862_CAPOD|nr:hypothetical protein Coch_1777 [Capnocytophaga ochracea DSM 7271]